MSLRQSELAKCYDRTAQFVNSFKFKSSLTVVFLQVFTSAFTVVFSPCMKLFLGLLLQKSSRVFF